MNDRSLHYDPQAKSTAVKEPEPEQPTPAAEVMIELMKRVSALEKEVGRIHDRLHPPNVSRSAL